MSPEFFLSTANGFLYANKLFPKTNFLHAKLNFCVHNIVLDTIILALSSFLLFFYEKAENSYFFVWRVYVCLDQCLII